MKSLDPRINRINLVEDINPIKPKEHWHTYEVFHKNKRGAQPVHVGSVHAPDPELALVFAKEQYARRKKCVNLWIVKTSDIHSFNLEDEDMFSTNPEKVYREAAGFKVSDKISKYKEGLKTK